jgi:transcriptional regulator NrdR family protein
MSISSSPDDERYGPVIECPRCECNDTKVMRTGTSWGKPIERRRCAFCGFSWNHAIVTRRAAAADPAAAIAAADERRRKFIEHKRATDR